jgi:phosphoribosylaminoimidazole carboxylase (NCAIR synthetase)
MHVLFVAPEFPAYQRKFVQALRHVGARVTGLGEVPAEHLPEDLKRSLNGYERVKNVCDPQSLLDAVRRVQARQWVDRLEATIESHVLCAAQVREAATIPGLSSRTATICRDKPTMKAFMRNNGIPCAASAAVDSPDDAFRFAREVGYPLILKPRDGAGASGTSRVNTDADMRAALIEMGVPQGRSVAIEEYIEGHEGFYDTLTINGDIAHDFISHYYPNVLDAMRNRWISPQILTTNRTDSSGYDALKRLGQQVNSALNVGTTATHMEWFYGPKGLKFSEIGARPPGVGTWDLYSAANDINLYEEWAHAIVHGRPSRPLSRRYAAGLIALRPDRDGRIARYEGVDEVYRRFGSMIMDAHLPPPGTPTQPVEAGYMANAWIRLRHPDYDTLREVLNHISHLARVRAVG